MISLNRRSLSKHTLITSSPTIVHNGKLFIDAKLLTHVARFVCNTGISFLFFFGRQMKSLCLLQNNPTPVQSPPLEKLKAYGSPPIFLYLLKCVRTDSVWRAAFMYGLNVPVKQFYTTLWQHFVYACSFLEIPFVQNPNWVVWLLSIPLIYMESLPLRLHSIKSSISARSRLNFFLTN